MWLVYACHGLNVTTIEGLGSHKGGYHPIQNALYQYNGSQCGYCSPAMVMNMYSLLEENNGKVTMEQVENSFGGNICRCTGYRPILDAFKSLAIDAPIDDIENDRVTCCRWKNSSGHYRHSSLSAIETALKSERFDAELVISFKDSRVWHRVESLQELFNTLVGRVKNEKYILIAGDTAHGTNKKTSFSIYFLLCCDI